MADIGYAYPYLILYIEPHVIYIYPTAKLHNFILRQLLFKAPFRETNNFIREFCDKCILVPTDYEKKIMKRTIYMYKGLKSIFVNNGK